MRVTKVIQRVCASHQEWFLILPDLLGSSFDADLALSIAEQVSGQRRRESYFIRRNQPVPQQGGEYYGDDDVDVTEGNDICVDIPFASFPALQQVASDNGVDIGGIAA